MSHFDKCLSLFDFSNKLSIDSRCSNSKSVSHISDHVFKLLLKLMRSFYFWTLLTNRNMLRSSGSPVCSTCYFFSFTQSNKRSELRTACVFCVSSTPWKIYVPAGTACVLASLESCSRNFAAFQKLVHVANNTMLLLNEINDSGTFQISKDYLVNSEGGCVCFSSQLIALKATCRMTSLRQEFVFFGAWKFCGVEFIWLLYFSNEFFVLEFER